jgi:signal transduction histidine kinase
MNPRARLFVSLAVTASGFAVVAAFALSLWFGLERQTVIDELGLRHQLAAGYAALEDAVAAEFRLVERSWGRQFAAALDAGAGGGAPDAAAGAAVEQLRAALIDKGLVSAWTAFKETAAGAVYYAYRDGAFAAVGRPDWLDAAAVASFAPQALPAGAAGPPAPATAAQAAAAAQSADSPAAGGLRRFSPARPVLFPESSVYRLAVLIDLDVLKTVTVPRLSALYFPDRDASRPTRVAVFEYSGGLPPGVAGADLALPLFAFAARDGQDPARPAWSDGDWGLSVHYGEVGIAALIAERRRSDAALCRLLFAALSAALGLAFAAERRFTLGLVREKEFIALFSHELKTPLAVIRSTAENMAFGLNLGPEEVRAKAAVIVDADRRLSALVDTIMAIAAGAGRPGVRFDLQAAAAAAVDRAQEYARERGATVELTGMAAEGAVFGDEKALASVIDSLIVNAVRYGLPTYGAHRVTVQVFEKTERRFGRFGEARRFVYLVVGDRGRGVPAREVRRARAGRIGRAGRREGEGTGFGLPLAMKTVRANGGLVRFARWPGACVIVRLPAAER